jgi:hypothetical protein
MFTDISYEFALTNKALLRRYRFFKAAMPENAEVTAAYFNNDGDLILTTNERVFLPGGENSEKKDRMFAVMPPGRRPPVQITIDNKRVKVSASQKAVALETINGPAWIVSALVPRP